MNDCTRLSFQSTSQLGRFGVMGEGWSRCSQGIVAQSINDIYDTQLTARSITFQVDAIPVSIS